MNEHTPGPWETSVGLIGDWQVCKSDGGDMIAELAFYSESEANANLIAAAPDLLAACIAMRRTMLWTKGLELHLADAAIKKARGPE